MSMTSPAAMALLAFISTTLDDFAVVLIFFGREYVKERNICAEPTRSAFFSIIGGQLLAFTIIVSVSLGVGLGLRKAIDGSYIDLIGFLPILIGLYKIYEILDEDGFLECCECCSSTAKIESNSPDSIGEAAPLVTEPKSSDEANDSLLSSLDKDALTQMVANAYGSSGLFVKKDSPDELAGTPQLVPLTMETARPQQPKFSKWRNPLLEEVTLYGLLFGTDNISIYVSLICSVTDDEIILVFVIFYALLIFYLAIAVIIITQVTLSASLAKNVSLPLLLLDMPLSSGSYPSIVTEQSWCVKIILTIIFPFQIQKVPLCRGLAWKKCEIFGSCYSYWAGDLHPLLQYHLDWGSVTYIIAANTN